MKVFANTLAAALTGTAFYGISGTSARAPMYEDGEHFHRHRSVQEHSCGVPAFSVSGATTSSNAMGQDVNISAQVCSMADADADGGASSMVASGKMFSSVLSGEIGRPGHMGFLFHTHCFYKNREGVAFIGVEVEEMRGSIADHLYDSGGNRLLLESPKHPKGIVKGGLERGLDADTPDHLYNSGGNQRSLKKSKKCKSKKSKKMGSKKGCSTTWYCHPMKELDEDGCCAGEWRCCSHMNDRRLVEARGHLKDAERAVSSGNAPSGTLCVFRIEKKAGGGDRLDLKFQTEFATTCEGFDGLVEGLEFEDDHAFKVTDGEFMLHF